MLTYSRALANTFEMVCIHDGMQTAGAGMWDYLAWRGLVLRWLVLVLMGDGVPHVETASAETGCGWGWC